MKPPVFWSIREEDFSLAENSVLVWSRVIMPRSVQHKILKKIPQSHMDIEKYNLRVISALYNEIYEEIGMLSGCYTRIIK